MNVSLSLSRHVIRRVRRVRPVNRQCLRRTSSTPATTPPLKVWWDTSCPLCTREISLMKRLDTQKNIDFIPITKDTDQGELPTGAGTSCPIDRKTLLKRFHAQERGEEIVNGAEAFAAMWRQIHGLRWLGMMARNRAMLWVLERVYRGFLRVRPRLQHWAGKR